MGAPDPMKKRHPLPYACIIGLASFIAAAVFLFINPLLSAAMLSAFVLVCIAAPFFPGSGVFMPVIKVGSPDSEKIAITFDDGPDPRTTPFLLDLLASYNTIATFFVTGCNARANPDLIKKILRAGHSIGNHTYTHDVLVMLKSGKNLALEIDSAQDFFKTMGITPMAFRPPAGVVNPKLGPLLKKRGMICVHYSCSARDMGNRRIHRLSAKILKKAKAGDIVLLHDACPDSRRFSVEKWLAEIDKILAGISQKGLTTSPLDRLIGRTVMLTGNCRKNTHKNLNT